MGVTKRVVIVYHGTNWVNAKKILNEGFKAGSYFAMHLEDAVGYGGVYVFEVAYPIFLIPKRCWQFVCENSVPTEFIVRLTKYNRSKVVVDNMVLRHLVCISNSSKTEVKYTTDDMKINPDRYSEPELVAYGVKG